jgi:hypothetical protein
LQWCGVFLRYNLWVLPILLLFCSVGLNAVRRKPYGAIVTVAVLSVIAFASPLPGIYWKPNNFMNAPSFQLAFTQPAQRAWLASIGDRAPEFFRRLAEEPGGLIVETPWLGVNLSVFNGQLQAIHRHPVAIGFLDDWGPGWFPLWHPDLHFRNFVKATDLAEMQRRGARYLVIHKHLRNEVEHLLPWKMPEGYPAPSLEKYEARWWATLGAPIYEDRWIRVHAVPPADPHLAGPDP